MKRNKEKDINEKIPKILLFIIVGALYFTVYGIIMVYRNITPITKDYSKVEFNRNYINRTEVLDNVFIDDIYTFDTINGNNYKSELYFMNKFYNYKNNLIGEKIELKNNTKNRYITLYFAFYYLIITIVWIIVFYKLYLLVKSHKENLIFIEKNERRLKHCSKLIYSIAFFKIFGIYLISELIYFINDFHIYIQFTNYSRLTNFILLGLFAGLLNVISIAYKKGFFIEKDQELTV